MPETLSEILRERARVLGARRLVEPGRPAKRDPLSYRELAALAPVDHSTIADYVRGKNARPSSAKLEAMARGFADPDCPAPALLRRLRASVGLPPVGDDQAVIDIPEVADLTHAEVRLVENMVRALAVARREGAATALAGDPTAVPTTSGEPLGQGESEGAGDVGGVKA